jgi:multicomponent Na+:H+ antiporter subunit G
MSTAADVVTSILLLASVTFVLLACLGLYRFDDVFSRIHAATKSITLGVIFVAAGTALQLRDPGDTVKLAIAAVLQLISAPVTAHMIGRAAYWSGTELSPETIIDQLADTDIDHLD